MRMIQPRARSAKVCKTAINETMTKATDKFISWVRFLYTYFQSIEHKSKANVTTNFTFFFVSIIVSKS